MMQARQLTNTFIGDGSLLLLEVLGEGVSGIVYRALDVKDNARQYAVKWIPKAPQPSPQYARRIRAIAKEIELQQTAQPLLPIPHRHPNVVAHHRMIEDDDGVFLVLDYCAGGDLYDLICSGEAPFFRNDVFIKSIFVQILDAVQSLHDRGVYHRDLKPENILLSADRSEAYVCDFGLATADAVSREFGCGSRGYMSPECIHYGAIELHSYSTRYNDIWSLGVILLAMVTGTNLWREATWNDDGFVAFMHEPEDTLLRHFPLSAATVTILLRIFQLNPLSRPSIAELRKMILQLDSFFSSTDSAASVGQASSSAGKHPQLQILTVDLATAATEDDEDADIFKPRAGKKPRARHFLSISGSSNDVYLYESPLDAERSMSSSLDWPPSSRARPQFVFTVQAPTDDEDSDDSDSDESEGPDTPIARAVVTDVEVEVPDMPGEMGCTILSPEQPIFPSKNLAPAPATESRRSFVVST